MHLSVPRQLKLENLLQESFYDQPKPGYLRPFHDFVSCKSTEKLCKESKQEDNRENLFTSLKELNEIVDLLEEKTNQDILQAMFEVTGHLGLYGAQIKVTLLFHSSDGRITSYFSDIQPPFSNLSFFKYVDWAVK